jgi:GT2 family glycosyltransferase
MDTVPVGYVNALLALEKPHGTQILHLPLSLVYVAREKMAEYAIEQGYDYVLFLDSDMTPPPDALTKLLAYNKDIVCGAYYTRKPPHTPCFFNRVTLDSNIVCECMTEYPRGLVEVEAAGTAFMLIKTDVFRSIYQAGRSCFFPIVGIGEDIAFCLRAREQGYKIYVDTALQIGHIGTVVYGEEAYLSGKRSI